MGKEGAFPYPHHLQGRLRLGQGLGARDEGDHARFIPHPCGRMKRMRPLLFLAKTVALGGAAALEGVMMKSPQAWALAVRLPGGQIHVERHEERALTERYPWTRLPLLRGWWPSLTP